MNERYWFPLAGHSNYEISTCGEVRSVARVVETSVGPRAYVSKILRQHVSKLGYVCVGLSVKKGATRVFGVHRLLAMTFIPNDDSENKTMVCHCDGNKLNNALTNLRWDTPKANYQDAVLHGTYSRGERHGQSKLSVTQVMAVRESDLTPNLLAEIMEVCPSTIRNIRRGAAWKHLNK